MPKWEVSYTTTTEPTDLPSGAEVKRVSAYPLTIRRGGVRLDLNKVPPTTGALASDLVASLKLGGRPVHLNATEARILAAELVSLADERKAHTDKLAAEKRAAGQRAQREANEAHARRIRAGLRQYPSLALLTDDPIGVPGGAFSPYR